MSRHWRPEGKIDSIRPVGGRRDWARAQAYWRDSAPRRRLPPGAAAGLLLVASACVGLGVGLYSSLGPLDVSFSGPDVVAEQAAPVETILPEAAEPGDSEWQARAYADGGVATGLPRARGARNDSVRASFSFCHSGGGTDCVVDGDTFYLNGNKVRIAGIDAPETHPPRCAREAELGAAATAQLRALLNSGAVTMTGIGRDRDAYGRLLRNVAVNGADVGEALIAAGVARDYAGGRRSWC